MLETSIPGCMVREKSKSVLRILLILNIQFLCLPVLTIIAQVFVI